MKILRKNSWSNWLTKVGLPPSKKLCFICFNDSPLKMMKSVFEVLFKFMF